MSTVLLSLWVAISIGGADASATAASVGTARAGHAGVDRLSHAARSSVAALVAVALRGDIYTVSVSGGSARQLTNYGLNSAPALSPHESLIAYLSTSKQFTDKYGNAKTHGVWVMSVDGSGARKITDTNPKIDRGGLSWSPDGQRLAYYEGDGVVVSDDRGGHRTVALRTGRPFDGTMFGPLAASPIAWSPDSRRIAVALPYKGQSLPRVLRVAVVSAGGGGATTATVTFPSGVLGNPTPPGSFPANNALAWSPDGRRLVVETLAEGEGPDRITGIWQVAATGGVASLLVGTAKGVRSADYPTDSPLNQPTHFAFSPDGRRLATDPEQNATYDQARFWIAASNGTGGRFLDLGLSRRRGCALAQYAWLNDGVGLAYVTVRGTGANTGKGPLIRATLYTVLLGAGQPRELLHIDDVKQDLLRLTPAAYRCVACGY